MKLIIDIPKELYDDIKYNFDKQNYCECGGYLISSKIVFGTPLEEEFKKIKAEIEEIKGLRDNPYNNEIEYSVSMKELRKLFDEHIAKLKGEYK